MYQRILVPVDGSDVSDAALAHAISLAASVGAQLRLVHIVEEEMTQLFDVSGVDLAAEESEERRVANNYLDAAAERARREGVPVETVVMPSEGAKASAALAADAEEWKADLIVAGTHARGGVRKALFGSTANELVQEANTPVLLIRA